MSVSFQVTTKRLNASARYADLSEVWMYSKKKKEMLIGVYLNAQYGYIGHSLVPSKISKTSNTYEIEVKRPKKDRYRRK